MRVLVVAVVACMSALAIGASPSATSRSVHPDSRPLGSGSRSVHPGRFIVEGASTAAAAAGVIAHHGVVVSRLPIVNAVVAELTPAEATASARAGLQISPDSSVSVEGGGASSSTTASDAYNIVSGATTMWAEGDKGAGINVAVLDTGIQASIPDLSGRVVDGVSFNGSPTSWGTDAYGHGTFVAGLIAGTGASSNGLYSGVAPGAGLVSIKVAGATGRTNESTVIEGISWAIAHASADNIRVLNISLGVKPKSGSGLDFLDQAVEQAWNAGIVVVTSAGNYGPDNGTISSPGNDPLAISVGAIDDDAADIAANFNMFSSTSVGPTLYNGWIKPDIVASGRSVVSLMPLKSTIAKANASSRIGTYDFAGSGTSFSSAVVSGLVALLLAKNPTLTPNQVKAALLMSALPGPVGDPLVDGHGIADVAAASLVAGLVNLNQSAAAAAEATKPKASVALLSAWTVSTWNPANWSGPAWLSSSLSSLGSGPAGGSALPIQWAAAALNGTSWTGAAWNGVLWSAAKWSGANWRGDAWDGAAWNGAAWNGAAWNGAAWNGNEWG